MGRLLAIRFECPVLTTPVAVWSRADLRPAFDRMALGRLPARDHVVALQCGDGQEYGQDERAERAGRVYVATTSAGIPGDPFPPE